MRFTVALVFFAFICGSFTSSNKPRRSVSYDDMTLRQFKESVDVTSLMISEDIGQLVVGATGKVFTLNLDNINEKTSEALWTISSQQRESCKQKGRMSEECDNFIRILHTVESGKILACGSNAYNPQCDYLSVQNGKVSFQGSKEGAKGKLPYNPYTRFASLWDGNNLYSASDNNFLGTEVMLQRHGEKPIKNENLQFWFNVPTMISLSLVEVSKNSEDGEDDYVFLFFTEDTLEERTPIQVSRIARVCKSDVGGQRTLTRKWTSFLKARLDCPFGDAGSPTLVQDVFLVPNQDNWSNSIFYAIFTSNSRPSGSSRTGVCAYKLSDIKQVFSGSFLSAPVGDNTCWETNTETAPPYPQSCINNDMRAQNLMTSINMPDKTLMFAKNHQLMKDAVQPLTGKPLLVHTDKRFSKIVIDEVTSLDGRQHQIMLIATDSGWLQKAVRFDGEESRIIEELQLFQTPQPINFLQLSRKTGQLYGCSNNVVVQMDVRDCSHYRSCDDCLLARDPYCGWDQIRGQCVSVVGASTGSMIQSLTDGDIQMCPTSVLKPVVVQLTLGEAQFLPCSPKTNLPVSWTFSNSADFPGPQHTVISQGLIVRPSLSDAGLYTCETTETVKGKLHRKTVIQYTVQVGKTSPPGMKVAVIVLGVYASLMTLPLCIKYLIRCIRAKQMSNVNVNHPESTVGPFP